uniref:SEC7 domain-containing protein n=1 Tax=Tetranychus urticae TaxID=32264 RepID=T1KAA6_TETUR
MEMFSQIIEKITTEAQQSSAQSIVNQAREIKEPTTIAAFKAYILDDYLKLLSACLSSKNAKLRQFAINGYETIIRDNSLWRPDVCENHFFNRIIASIGSKITSCNEITQIELLKCLLEVTCSRISHLRFTDLVTVSDICCSTIISCATSSTASPLSPTNSFTSSITSQLSALKSPSDPFGGSFGSPVSPKITAATATAIQSNRYFVGYLITESSIELRDAINHQIIPLLDSLTTKILDLRKRCYSNGKDKSSRTQVTIFSIQISFHLKCITAILTSLEIDKQIEKDVSDFVWQKLGPMLIKLLNLNMSRLKSPKVKNVKKSRKNSKDLVFGRGAECLSFIDKNIIQLKEVYEVSRELVQLFGQIKYMRPVLESIFHRMLLYPLIHFRLEALQSVKEVYAQCTIKLCTTIKSQNQLSCTNQDLNLIKIIIDSLHECSSTNDQEIAFQSVYCIMALIETLDFIASGKSLAFQEYSSHKLMQDDLQEDYDKLEMTTFKNKLKEIMGHSQDEVQSDGQLDDYEADEDETASDEIFVTDEGASLKQSISSLGSQCALDEPNCDEDANDEISIIENKNLDNVFDGNNEDDQDYELSKYRSKIISEVREENERHQTILNCHDLLSNQERENARDIIKDLTQILPELLAMKNSIQIDNALQKFSSNFCKAVWEKRKTIIESSSDPLIINGDGVYLAVYSALSLNLKLIKEDYYNESKQINPPITEQEFIDDIYNSGVLVYLSSTWLAELYQQILANNLLGDSGYMYSSSNNTALINMIRDIDGDSDTPGSYELSDYRKLTQTSLQLTNPVNDGQNVGRIIARRVLDTFWDSIISIMESIFTSDANSSNQSPFLLILNHGSEKDNTERRSILINCLATLQTASKLCIALGLQSRCNGIFHLLSRSILVSPLSKIDKENDIWIENKGAKSNQSKKTPISLHVSQVLSLRSMLTAGLQIATHCEPCWDYMFQSCTFISELENEYFSSRTKKPLKSRLSSLLRSRKQSNDPLPEFSQIEVSSNFLGLETESDVNKCLEQCINAVINEKNGRKGDGILVDSLLERSLECLSHLSDRLFTEATSRLNLKSLLAFLEALISNSSRQINALSKKAKNKSPCTLLFARFCDVLLRIGKSGRPLIHFMRCWALAVPHLIEASNCQRFDITICKSAVSAVNDIISTILAIHTELDYFHFNEALFIPYEKILLLELCDSDIQEMIVSSICGFVEGSREDVRSGWRSLFAALRGVVLPESGFAINSQQNSVNDLSERQIERVRQLRVILDIFEAFLNTQNLDIFANAALDCIICLLGLMKDPLAEETNLGENELISISNETNSAIERENSVNENNVDLCLLSLKYLHQFESMLRSMYKMPGCPFFISSRRITLCEESKTIEIPENWSSELSPINLDIPIKLSSFDKPSRILNVWFTLVDGIFNCINRCPKIRQSKTIETCMAILGTLRSNPGNQFAIYCINHVALPFLQRWIREINNQLSFISSLPSPLMTNFKHFFGLISHFVVQHVKLWSEDKSILGVDLMLSQTVIILIEATQSSYKEAISNLSFSCFSHVIMETYQYYDDSKWDIISTAFRLMHKTCLTSLIKLINAFPNRTLDFYQDLERIRVVARRVQIVPKADLITKKLAQQIFLLDFQTPKESDEEIDENFSETEKCFVFEIITDENNELEIPFRSLIREIYKHSSLVKLIESIVLTDRPFRISPVSYFIEANDNYICTNESTSISQSFIFQSLDLLMESYRNFHEFDTRLGLKLVIQKMARIHVPANLYKQTASCFASSFLICFNSVILGHENGPEEISRSGSLLRKIFEKMCGNYTDLIVQCQQENGKLDQLMSNPVFLFPESLNESSESNDDKVDIKDESNDFEIGSVDSFDQESKHDNSKETKKYIVMSKNRIDNVMKNYRKWKSQHSPLPPSFNDSWNQKNQLPKRYRGNLDLTNGSEKDQEYLVKDTDAYETLFSQILISIFECMLTLPDSQFDLIMPFLNEGIENLIIYAQSKDLRSVLALLYRRYAQRR